jgi:hypothetical protein
VDTAGTVREATGHHHRPPRSEQQVGATVPTSPQLYCLINAASRLTVTGYHSVRVIAICTVHQILFILPKWVAWAAEEENIHFMRFQVLTATSENFRVFWDVAPCNQVEVDRRI